MKDGLRIKSLPEQEEYYPSYGGYYMKGGRQYFLSNSEARTIAFAAKLSPDDQYKLIRLGIMWEHTRNTHRGLRDSELERKWLTEKRHFDELPWWGHMKYVVPSYDLQQIVTYDLHFDDEAAEAFFTELCLADFTLYPPYNLALDM